MSKLTQDLHTVAGIVGSLGLGIAEAQREMNRDYLEAVERLAAIAISLQNGAKPATGGAAAGAPTDKDREFITDFLGKFAPTRYQYTKTTLKVRLDLAQTFRGSGSAGVGGSLGAVALNASFAMAYGSDYQAAAECTTVIDAVPAKDDVDFIRKLSETAATADATKLTLPARSAVDAETIKTSNAIIEKLLGIKAASIA